MNEMFVKSTRFEQVCQLLLSLIVATEGKIKTLRLDTLKKACLSLDVEVTGSKARKDTFALALDKYICTHRSKSCKYCHDRC